MERTTDQEGGEMSGQEKKWYKVSVLGTGYYTELVEATSEEEAERLQADGEGVLLREFEMSGCDGVEVEEASAEEIKRVTQEAA